MRTLDEAASYLRSLGFFAKVRPERRELVVGSPPEDPDPPDRIQVITDASHIEEKVPDHSYLVSLVHSDGINYDLYMGSLDSLMEKVVAHYVMIS